MDADPIIILGLVGLVTFSSLILLVIVIALVIIIRITKLFRELKLRRTIVTIENDSSAAKAAARESARSESEAENAAADVDMELIRDEAANERRRTQDAYTGAGPSTSASGRKRVRRGSRSSAAARERRKSASETETPEARRARLQRVACARRASRTAKPSAIIDASSLSSTTRRLRSRRMSAPELVRRISMRADELAAQVMSVEAGGQCGALKYTHATCRRAHFLSRGFFFLFLSIPSLPVADTASPADSSINADGDAGVASLNASPTRASPRRRASQVSAAAAIMMSTT